MVAFNKWDLIADKGANTHLAHWEAFCKEVPFLTYAPWFTVSAETRQRTGKIMETVWDVHEQRRKRIPTSQLNAFLEGVIAYQQPRTHGGGVGKIYFATQIEQEPPVDPAVGQRTAVSSPANYLRFINNQIRKEYGFTGTPDFCETEEALDGSDFNRNGNPCC